MGYAQGNERTIRRAFNRLKKRSDPVIEDGMRRLLREAMTFAVTNHDHNHFAHRIHDNSYGWALLKDGAIVDIQVNGGRHGHADAEDQLRRVAGEVSQGGWVGILLASMYLQFSGRKPVYFEIDYEMGILELTKDEIRSNFTKYFKPIA